MAKKYPSFKKDLAGLINSLKAEPQQGEPLGKDCFKIRFAISSKNKGKRGSARAVTCVKIIEERVVMLALYDKAETATLTDDEIAQRLTNADLL